MAEAPVTEGLSYEDVVSLGGKKVRPTAIQKGKVYKYFPLNRKT